MKLCLLNPENLQKAMILKQNVKYMGKSIFSIIVLLCF